MSSFAFTIIDLISFSVAILLWIMVPIFFRKLYHLLRRENDSESNSEEPQEFELEGIWRPPLENNHEQRLSESTGVVDVMA
jgi:hypothetical protein